jgi:hypothetical protein
VGKRPARAPGYRGSAKNARGEPRTANRARGISLSKIVSIFGRRTGWPGESRPAVKTKSPLFGR